MLRDYEILFIVRPELDEDQVGKAVESVTELIQNLGGERQKTDVWGRRRLAYEVSHLREGHYVLTDFRLDPERVKEMEATLGISETVFRHLITRKPEKARKGSGAQPTAAAAPTAGATAEAPTAQGPAATAVVEPETSPEPAQEEDQA